MRTYCVFQSCDKHGLNRLVDKICANVQDGLDWYKSWTRGEILFLPTKFGEEEVPDSLMFFKPDDVTPSDVEWLRQHQDYNSGYPELIQEYADKGYLGIFRAIAVRVHDDEVFIKSSFLIELRHIYQEKAWFVCGIDPDLDEIYECSPLVSFVVKAATEDKALEKFKKAYPTILEPRTFASCDNFTGFLDVTSDIYSL